MDIGRGRSTMNVALWIVQGLLAALFLFAGGAKLLLPLDQMAGPVALPGWFLRFLGVAEVLGALGLVLPGLLRIRPGLTPLAAAGLVIIMIGADRKSTRLNSSHRTIAYAVFCLKKKRQYSIGRYAPTIKLAVTSMFV